MQRLHGRIVHSRDQLIALRSAGLSARTSEIPEDLEENKDAGEERNSGGEETVETTGAYGEEENIIRVSPPSSWPR